MSPDPNYDYWQQHGGDWPGEYAKRKQIQPYYHLQELMLADYVLHHAQGESGPLRVLEFGCGVGRHLRNLSRLPGVDVHGFDQSPTMIRGCLEWTGQDWIDRHITLGSPTGPLPFADAAFDIVYTSEVLIHVRPEHLDDILKQLVRVAKGQVLHMEPAATTPVAREAHHGCWNHDLVAAYARLGHQAEVLPQGFRLQAPVRVRLANQRPWTWSPVLLEMMRRAEADLEQGLEKATARAAAAEPQAALARSLQTALDEARRGAEWYRHASELASAWLHAKSSELARVQAETDRLRVSAGQATQAIEELRAKLQDATTQAAGAAKAAELDRARHARELTDLAGAKEARFAALARESERTIETLTQRVGELEAERDRAVAAWRAAVRQAKDSASHRAALLTQAASLLNLQP